jgi:hypothetical protein
MKTEYVIRMAVASYLGIPDEKKGTFQDFLVKAASKDFWHDFHHAKLAKILDRVVKSNNPALGVSTGEYNKGVFELRKRVLALRSANPGASLYDMFMDNKSPLYLVDDFSINNHLGLKSEEDIFNRISNLEFNTIRQTLIGSPDFKGPLTFKPIAIHIGDTTRNYNLAATIVKKRSEYISIAGSFSALSNGGTNFILLIDASNLAISQLMSLAADPSKIYNFFIIQSVENEGDPATKIANFIAGQPNIHVYFLRDTGFRTSYTPFNHSGFTSNLFSSSTISATRNTEGTITADITAPGVDIRVEDIGTASEPEEAGFLAFLKLIASNFTNWEEAMAYFLLKRAGDWCQALCLLDRGRTYTVEPIGGSPPLEKPEYTLEELINFLKLVEIALLTHDKILLAYALALGLNVFFTMKVVAPGVPTKGDEEETSNSNVWLTYFKNQLDSNLEAIKAAADLKSEHIGNELTTLLRFFNIEGGISAETLTALDAELNNTYTSIPQQCIDTIVKLKTEGKDIPQFLVTARVLLQNASQFDTKPKNTVLSLGVALQTIPADPREYFELVSRTETEIQQYVSIVKHFISFQNTINDVNENKVAASFEREMTNIINLFQEIDGQKPIETIDHAPYLNFQTFLEKTLPSLKEDTNSFSTQFPEREAELLVALQIPETRNPEKRKVEDSYKKFYRKYQTLFSIQQGGDTPFEKENIYPLQANKIRTRKSYGHYDLDAFLQNFQNQYMTFAEDGGLSFTGNPPEFIEAVLLPRAKQLYEHFQMEGRIQEPSLGNLLESIFDTYINKFQDLHAQDRSAEEEQAFEEAVNEELEELSYEEEQQENLIDIGTSVTYEDGDSYTAVDICVIKKEQQYLWDTIFSNLHTFAFENQQNPLFLYYRFLLFNLDIFTNQVNALHELTNDMNPEAEPYLAEENELYVRKIRTCLDMIKAFAEQPVVPESFSSLATFVQKGLIDVEMIDGENVEKFPPHDTYISKEIILKEISIHKAYVIIKYYEAQGALFTPPKPTALSEHQLVRLFYLLLSSQYEYDTLRDILPAYAEQNSIAYNFFHIFETDYPPEGFTDEIYNLLVKEAKAYNDNLFDFLPGLAKGGKRNRYRKTRSKPKRPQVTRKRRLAHSRKKKALKAKKATRKI